MISDALAAAALLGACAVTLLSKWLGVALMSAAPVTPRIEAALKALSGSVLVALVTPAAIQGGASHMVAIGVAAALTLATGRAIAAMLLAVAVVAALRAFGGA